MCEYLDKIDKTLENVLNMKTRKADYCNKYSK